MDEIKVVHVVTRMNVGGISEVVDQLLTGPSQEFKMFLLSGVCEANEVEHKLGPELISRVITIPSMRRSLNLKNDVKSVFHIRKIIKDLEPDIVHTHASKAGFIGRIAVITLKVKPRLVHSFHGHVLRDYFSQYVSSIFLGIEILLSFFTDYIVLDSTYLKNDLRKLKPKFGWQIINPAVNYNRFKDELNQPTISNHKNNAFEIIWIGRFEDVKNPMLAVQALQLLTPELQSRTHLTMIGDGSLKHVCEEYSKRYSLSISFISWKSDISPYLSKSDLLILTSKSEGFGLVILEAALFGIPSLSTKIGGVEDFIRNNMTGFLVSAEKHSFSHELNRLLGNPSLLNRVGSNAKNLVLNGFLTENLLNNHYALYRRINGLKL